MSALKAFLQPTVVGKTKEVIISERFKGEDGEPVPFVIQAISQERNEELSRLSRKESVVNGVVVDSLDNIAYTKRLMKECVKEPDLADSELCKYYGTMDPEDVLGKMLSIGEYNLLSEEIMKINDLKTPAEKHKEAKNS